MTTTTSRPFRIRLAALAGTAVAALALALVIGRPGVAPGVLPGGSPVAPGVLPGGSPVATGVLPGGSPVATGVLPGGSPGSGSASCVEPYAGPASIIKRTFAFDGTVSAINGDKVTFTVNQAYRGAEGASITLDAEGMTGTTITSAGGPTLAVGERYLVAGDDHFVWSCGYTQPYDSALAAQWQAAGGG